MSLQSISHGTQVEQSRAVAEVFAAAELATRFPRDERRAEDSMLRACARTSLAEAAEYALPRSGSKDVVGPSVHLARELALIWGNVTHGVVEISRNAAAGQSELMAYAWDVERNVRSARTFIVPHTRDKTLWENVNGRNKKVGTAASPIDTQQDITNQNNSVAARQLRETIFSVMPKWFTEDAITACRATVAGNEQRAVQGDQSTAPRDLAGKIKGALDWFGGGGIAPDRVAAWVGVPVEQWTGETLARVGVLIRSLQKREITLEQAFPPKPLDLDDIPAPPVDLDLEPTDAEREAARQREAEQHG